MQIRYLSHCNHTLLVQRSAKVWKQRLKFVNPLYFACNWLCSLFIFIGLQLVVCFLFLLPRFSSSFTILLLASTVTLRTGRHPRPRPSRCSRHRHVAGGGGLQGSMSGPRDWGSSWGGGGLDPDPPCAPPLRRGSSAVGSTTPRTRVFWVLTGGGKTSPCSCPSSKS